MRISYWSSDVCSSDRAGNHARQGAGKRRDQRGGKGIHALADQGGRRCAAQGEASVDCEVRKIENAKGDKHAKRNQAENQANLERTPQRINRSEERRVGKECVRTGRFRWATEN